LEWKRSDDTFECLAGLHKVSWIWELFGNIVSDTKDYWIILFV